jgi:hypothetical protein
VNVREKEKEEREREGGKYVERVEREEEFNGVEMWEELFQEITRCV